MSSIVNYVADGSTTEFQIPFTYISEAHVVVTIDGTATSAFTFLNSSTLQMTTAPTAGSKLQIQRTTPVGALVDFTDGSTLFEGDLDLAHQQNRLIAEESKDIANVAKTTIDNNIADVNTVAGIAADVTNVASRGADVTSVADNMAEVLLADTNAVTATTKAAEAAVSANTASAQATISTTKAAESSASAAAALASQNAAQQARTDTDASEALALAYKNSAQTSATTATTKASEASQSATTASSQAATATQKASEASTDAGIALAQAAVATTKAAAASTSESNALSYKDTALAASSASETARAASVVAKDASQVAQTASEAARDAASASETAAATSESNAAASEGVATTQAGISTTKAGEAATSASNAASSASSAQASKDAALAALDSFDDRYLGQKTADPTLDNDGDALVSGALYFNTTDDIMKVYDGSLWVAAYASLSGAMFGANNLSDVASISASRTTLGLGTGDTPTFAGINTTGNATFGDNDKAIFGAGSDLQIYHDGVTNNSYIREVAPDGSLFIEGSNLFLRSGGGDEFIKAVANAQVELYYDDALKLATTSTGIDVTGTVTADGLTVDGTDLAVSFNGSSKTFVYLTEGDTTDLNTKIYQSGGNFGIQTISDNLATSKNRLKVDHSTGDISFYEDTGTTPKMVWKSADERLGIGTSSPTTKLQSKGGSISTPTDNAGLIANASASFVVDHGNDYGLYTGYVASANDAIGIAATRTLGGALPLSLQPFGGNVGIGTSSPSHALTVKGSGVIGKFYSDDQASELRVESPTVDVIGLYTGTNDSLTFGTNSTERMRIDSSGVVRIGGQTGTLKLGNDGTYHADIEWEYNNNELAFTANNTANFTFNSNGSERMRIDSSGNLLVGQSSSTAPASGNVIGAAISPLGYISTNRTSVSAEFGTQGDGDIVVFRENGSTVGSIGTASGTTYITGAASGLVFNSGRVGSCNTNGAIVDNTTDLGNTNNRFKDAYFSGTVNAANFNTTSDATLKTNVETLSGSLDAVKSLRGVSFDWLENGGSEIGVIAQEVEAVLPDVVNTNDEGIKSVKYGNMVAVLIEAIKEQQLRIEALEAKLGE